MTSVVRPPVPASPGTDPGAEVRSLRIGTWNVECAAGAAKNEERLARVLAADADVWVLTETHDDLALPAPYAAVHSRPRPGARRGARWVSIWSRIPVVSVLPTDDPDRTVAAELEGQVLVYGTVLPWHSDTGPTGLPATNWSEFRRVVPEQAAEWRGQRERHPDHLRLVAGDVNQSLGRTHYYGSKADRQLLETCLQDAGLTVLTGTADETTPLDHPPIDHVAAAGPAGTRVQGLDVDGWTGGWDGPGRLSDHSAVVTTVRWTARH